MRMLVVVKPLGVSVPGGQRNQLNSALERTHVRKGPEACGGAQTTFKSGGSTVNGLARYRGVASLSSGLSCANEEILVLSQFPQRRGDW